MSVKETGERLAKIAASSGIASKQLRDLLKSARTESLDWLEAKIKYQISRGVEGFSEFGNALLEEIDKHREDKPFIEDVLRYVCLTVDYYRTEKFTKIKPEIEIIVKRLTSKFGYQGTEISTERGLSIDIYLNNFYGNPRMLSEQIKEQLINNVRELQKTDFQTWINPRRR